MADEINTYYFEDFKVQSYMDERTARRLFEHIRLNKIMGRTAPPRKGFLRAIDQMLWSRDFEFEGQQYEVKGGGKELIISPKMDDEEIDRVGESYRECVICGLGHPDQDLMKTAQGLMCRPCHEARFPVCSKCGRAVELEEDQVPAEDPFICEDCCDRF